MGRGKFPRISSPEGDMARAVALLRGISSLRPVLGMVLGSGFQAVLPRVRCDAEIAFSKLPGFPEPTVPGHVGKAVVGCLGPAAVVVLSGRSHYYEGYSMEALTFPIRVLAEYGIRDLLLTNAAGGINRRLRAGDFMLLSDHINMMPDNPLRGTISESMPRFVDLTQTYDARLNGLLMRAAGKIKTPLHKGIYVAVAGPSYETPAEIRAFARLGADAVGMSTVPEAIVARQCGLAVAGLSCVTNLAAGRNRRPLSHAEVLAMGEQVGETAADLLQIFTELYVANQETR